MLKRFITAFLLGGTMVTAFAPLSWFPLAFVSLGGLVYLLERADRVRESVYTGFGWGLGCFLFGVSWLYIALNRFGGVPMPLAALSIILFCFYLALFPAIASVLYVRFRSKAGPLRQALLFAALWTLLELLRGWLFTGFPWLAIGYSQVPPSPLAGFFPVFGVYGVGFGTAFASASLALIWKIRTDTKSFPAKSVKPAVVSVIVIAVGLALWFVPWVSPHGEPVRVALLQTNIEQSLKWAPERLEEWLEVNARMVRNEQADLVVLPETTLPLLLEEVPRGYLDYLTDGLRAGGGNLVFGIFIRDDAGRIYNAALSYGSSASQYFAKSHLVPFGEYSPPLFGWFYRFADIPMSDQTPGDWQQPPLTLGDQHIAVNICYEDLFGRELLRFLPEATLMLNLSNLAWYGDSLAQPQHLQIARARALETGRPMLRATNTGMTGLVLPDGEIADVLPAFTRDVLRVEVPGYQGMTPYARWGDWGVAVLVLIGLYGGIAGRQAAMV